MKIPTEDLLLKQFLAEQAPSSIILEREYKTYEEKMCTWAFLFITLVEWSHTLFFFLQNQKAFDARKSFVPGCPATTEPW